HPLGGIRRRHIQDIRSVRDDPLRIKPGFRDRRAKTFDSFAANGRFVAIELRNRGEELHRAHAGFRRTTHGHVEAAVVDGVCTDAVFHGLFLRMPTSCMRAGAVPPVTRVHAAKTLSLDTATAGSIAAPVSGETSPRHSKRCAIVVERATPIRGGLLLGSSYATATVLPRAAM